MDNEEFLRRESTIAAACLEARTKKACKKCRGESFRFVSPSKKARHRYRQALALYEEEGKRRRDSKDSQAVSRPEPPGRRQIECSACGGSGLVPSDGATSSSSVPQPPFQPAAYGEDSIHHDDSDDERDGGTEGVTEASFNGVVVIGGGIAGCALALAWPRPAERGPGDVTHDV